MNIITGLFEIHITFVNEDDSIMNLIKFKNAYSEKNLKMVLAVSSKGTHLNQLMISKWKSGTSHEAICCARDLVLDAEEYNLKILRIKVEAMASNHGVPQTNQEYINYTNSIKDINSSPYFEYHAKINLNGKTIDDTEILLSRFYAEYCNEMPETERLMNESNIDASTPIRVNVALSINAFSVKQKPLLTIRVYNCGFNNAEKIKNNIIDNHIKKHECTIEGCIQREFSIYDDNKGVDYGWLE